MKKERRHWSADDKIRLLRLHLIEKQGVSKICEEASLSPTQFYACQELLFANGSGALASKRVSERNKVQELSFSETSSCGLIERDPRPLGVLEGKPLGFARPASSADRAYCHASRARPR